MKDPTINSDMHRALVLWKDGVSCRIANRHNAKPVAVDLDAVIRGGGRIEDRIQLDTGWLLIVTDPGQAVPQVTQNVPDQPAAVLRIGRLRKLLVREADSYRGVSLKVFELLSDAAATLDAAATAIAEIPPVPAADDRPRDEVLADVSRMIAAVPFVLHSDSVPVPVTGNQFPATKRELLRAADAFKKEHGREPVCCHITPDMEAHWLNHGTIDEMLSLQSPRFFGMRICWDSDRFYLS